jgi:hypothetical protein
MAASTRSATIRPASATLKAGLRIWSIVACTWGMTACRSDRTWAWEGEFVAPCSVPDSDCCAPRVWAARVSAAGKVSPCWRTGNSHVRFAFPSCIFLDRLNSVARSVRRIPGGAEFGSSP